MFRRILFISLFLLPVYLQAQISPGPLSRVHSDLEGVASCTRCHAGANEVGAERCLECHVEISNARKFKRGLHAVNAERTCESCHKEHLGLDAVTMKFSPESFNHGGTGFPLDGKHASLECRKCHTPSLMKDARLRPRSVSSGRTSYMGLLPSCGSCHKDKHRETLGGNCAACHATDRWVPARDFDHKQTSFPLAGKHIPLTCEKCHVGFADRKQDLTFASKSFADCTPCHSSPHRPGFSTKPCGSCHSADGWDVSAGFDHASTKFPLEGRHSGVSCVKCHPGLGDGRERSAVSFRTKAFNDCSPCHATPHPQAFASRTCRSCHDADSWRTIDPRTFDHRLTSYELKGRHAAVACEKCHPREVVKNRYAKAFTGLKSGCVACHEDYHKGLFVRGYANDCALCHVEESFRPSQFTLAMHARSSFSLGGAHSAVPCARCHIRPDSPEFQMSFASTRCDRCHEDHHKGEFEAQMGTKSCDACHSTAEWNIRSFDHASTSFPLVGRHTGVACDKCHSVTDAASKKTRRYVGTPKTCFECHADIHYGQFASASVALASQNAVVTDCTSCHTPHGWSRLTFRHNTQSRFQLTGAHLRTPCRGCHPEEKSDGVSFVRYKPLALTCESCHKGQI